MQGKRIGEMSSAWEERAWQRPSHCPSVPLTSVPHPPIGIRLNCVAPFDPIRRAADRIRRACDRIGSMRGLVCPDFGAKLMPAVGVGAVISMADCRFQIADWRSRAGLSCGRRSDESVYCGTIEDG